MADEFDGAHLDLKVAGRAGAFSIQETVGNGVVGWVESLDPDCWVYVAVRTQETVLGITIANRFNRDAYANGHGAGWIGFKIDLGKSKVITVGSSVQLICLRSCKPLHTHVMQACAKPEGQRTAVSIYNFIQSQSRSLAKDDLWKLTAYLKKYRSSEGDVALVRQAYRYILRREPDAVGIVSYVEHLKRGMDPVYLLQELMGSDEFMRLKPRALALPGDLEFPFAARRTSW